MKRLSNGYYVVKLQISPEAVAFARVAARNGFYGVEDYLNAVLNMAMLWEMPEVETRATVTGSLAGQMRIQSPGGVSDEWDDLPF